MSADNWTICPKCADKHAENIERCERELSQSYGRISSEDWLALRDDAKRQRDVPVKETLREDYDIGVNPNGVFEIEYTASCECGFKFSFKHEADVS